MAEIERGSAGLGPVLSRHETGLQRSTYDRIVRCDNPYADVDIPGSVALRNQSASRAVVASTTMQQLRQATRVAHARVEAALPVLDPSLTRDRYARVVEALHGYYAAVEPLLEVALGCGDDPKPQPSRAKLPLLAADLRALGRTPSQIGRLPRCTVVPDVGTASHALGILYVFEGATLGGQIIAKHLRERLAIEPASGGAFFYGYGTATRSMWTRFAVQVDRSASVQAAAAVAAAIATFETLTQWLDAALARP